MTDKKLTDSEVVNNFCEVCGDNRFELIEKYKNELLEHTNIDTAKEEMAVIDSILFRFWQMDWLNSLEQFDRLQEEVENYKALYEGLKAEHIETIKAIKHYKAEAYKECIEKAKSKIDSQSHSRSLEASGERFRIHKILDNLLKELVGE